MQKMRGKIVTQSKACDDDRLSPYADDVRYDRRPANERFRPICGAEEFSSRLLVLFFLHRISVDCEGICRQNPHMVIRWRQLPVSDSCASTNAAAQKRANTTAETALCLRNTTAPSAFSPRRSASALLSAPVRVNHSSLNEELDHVPPALHYHPPHIKQCLSATLNSFLMRS
jgi:hypothetical protein